MTLEAASISAAPRRITNPNIYDGGPSIEEVRTTGATLARGQSGDGVRDLQRALNQAGTAPPLVIDGLFGPKTEDALRTITGRNGEPVTTVNAATWSRLVIESRREAPRGDTPVAPSYGAPAPEGTVPARDLLRDDEVRRRPKNQSGPPPGYASMTGRIPQGVVAKAKSLLHHDYGTEIPFELDGKRYMARLERHYHPPGFVGGPNGWHKGVTVYEAR